jgi:hypothetical protein
LADKGLIYDRGKESYDVLPLTRDYLSGKWNESPDLKRIVQDHFTAMFSSDRLPADGFLLDWPVPRRVGFLRTHAQQKFDDGLLDDALKLVRLAQSWMPDARLKCLEGRVLIGKGSRAAGISLMRHALRTVDHDEDGPADEYISFADALLAHGERRAEREAAQALSTGLRKGAKAELGLVTRCLDCCVAAQDYTALSVILSRVDDPDVASRVLAHLGELVDESRFMFTLGEDLAVVMDRASSSSNVLEADRVALRKKASTLREKMTRLRTH